MRLPDVQVVHAAAGMYRCGTVHNVSLFQYVGKLVTVLST